MEIGDWITLSAVIVALGIGVASILHTQNLQKKERRERLLKEIIEWAIDISKWRPKEIHRDLMGIRDKVKLQELIDAHIATIIDNLIEMRGRNQYMLRIAMEIDRRKPLTKQPLIKEVHNLINETEEYIELLDEWKAVIIEGMARDTVVDDAGYFEKAAHKEHELEKHVKEVIDEATKIKTRDIS